MRNSATHADLAAAGMPVRRDVSDWVRYFAPMSGMRRSVRSKKIDLPAKRVHRYALLEACDAERLGWVGFR